MLTGEVDGGEEDYLGGLLYNNHHADDGVHISGLELIAIKEYKGQGLGTHLLKKYVKKLKSDKVAKIIARAAIDATGFYKKRGW